MSSRDHDRLKTGLSRRVALLLTAAPLVRGSDWTRFRGDNGSGIALGTGTLPDRVSPTENVVWKTPTPAGHSSPVIWRDRVFITGAEGGTRASAPRDKIVDTGGRLYTLCLDRISGRILWRRSVPRPRVEAYQVTNSPASPSATTDGTAVYVFFGDYGLIAYSLDGAELWQHPLGPFNNVNGHGSSPIVTGGHVILICDQDTDSYLIALDKKTGKTAWRVERPEVTRSYCTPAIWNPPHGAPPELIVPGAFYVHGYNANTGEKLWWVRGMSWQPKSAAVVANGMIYAHGWESGGEADDPTETPAWRETRQQFDKDGDGRLSVAEVASDQRLSRGFVNTDLNMDGYLDEHDWENYRARRSARNALLAIRPGGRGDVTATHVAWSMRKFLPNVPSPLIYGGVCYLIKDGGILSAVDATTGAMLKQGRLTGALDTYYSSPVAGDGKVYLLSQPGKATVVKAGREWEILSQADFEDECYATPALLDGRIYLRTRGMTYCFARKSAG